MPQSQILDEETPFLANESELTEHTEQAISKKQRTPLPWRQFSIVLLLHVVGSITSQAIGPFLPQLIRDIGITNGKDSRVGYYVGLMHSIFALVEACTIFHWSRLSDKIGRRPVLLIGLFGLSLSMWCFGLSKTFWALVASRCINGALNGNPSVVKSMTIEITDSTNIAQAYGIIPMSSAFAATVGPLIGGSLARPAERFPKIFGDSEFLKEFPYFLPCAVPATITALSLLITFMFLKETKKPQMSLRQYLFGGITRAYKPNSRPQAHDVLHDDSVPEVAHKQLPFRALLIRPVLLAIGSYAAYTIISISISSITPVFYAMRIEMGGLDLDPPAIGTILSLSGISAGIISWLFFAPIHGWLGDKTMFLTVVSLYLPVVAMFPAINAMARVYGLGYFVWLLVGLQRLLLVFAGFSSELAIMYVGAAAPNKESIGATNGFSLMIIAFVRAVGPLCVNSAFSLSIEKNLMGGYLVYWVMVAMAGVTLWVGSLLPKDMWDE